MASIVRWITGRDEHPPASIQSRSSSGGIGPTTMIVRQDKDSPRAIAVSPMGPNSVTYASKDEKRNAQFVCHLPVGSEHAMQAQKIAASMYSGKPAGGNTRGENLLGNGESRLFLEDEASRARRERADTEYMPVNGRMRAGANRSIFSRDSARRASNLNEQYASSSDDEGPESVPPLSRRGTFSTTSTRYYTSDDGSTVVEVEPSEFEDEAEDHYYQRTPISTTSMRHGSTASVRAASLAMTPAAGRIGSTVSRTMSTTSSNSQASGFRHQSVTHTTYNIKNSENGRQLFVSAPTGSREAAIHDQVVMKASNSSPKASWIGNGGVQRGTISRRPWVGD